MSDLDPTTSAPSSAGIPYVGLRPFGPEERDLFYGRDADAQFLVDKILTARITLLYAPSGIGKSSLLRASVIPSLERDDCRVLYFDSWAGAEPAWELKKALSEIVKSAGISDPLAGAPTLAELVQLTAADGQTSVLVLDQFEEFLINHPSDIDPLRKELAALVRSQSIDARVLISLREEFLAAIEPFRQEILTLFQSTFRLESLPPTEVHKAIINPASRFGGEVEPQLVDRLVTDLSEAPSAAGLNTTTHVDPTAWSGWRPWIARIAERVRGEADTYEPLTATDEARSSRPASSGTIDLPMLQLVCEQMWKASPIVDGGRKLTLHLYEELGGKQKILGDHIRSRMPQRWRDRLFTATLMKFLAPPSGLKISYSGADLAAYTGLDQQRVEAELRRLSGGNARILRQREFKESVRFELQHDALIRHITPWRDNVLAEAAAMKRLKWAAGAVGLLILLLVGQSWYHRKQVWDNTDNRLKAMEKIGNQRVGNTFESVASYLLFQERGSERLDHLKRLLVENEKLLPEGYGTGAADTDINAPSNVNADSLSMRFSGDLALDVPSFNHAWSDVAHQISARWGIPIPTRVHLIADPDFPRAAIQFELGGQTGKNVKIDLEAPEGTALVSIAEAPDSIREFHERFMKDWQPLPGLESNSGEGAPRTAAWWAVPRWSLPVWRSGGLRVWPASAYPALAMQTKLERDPTMLLNAASVEFLVQRVAQDYPCTAAEVWSLRGNKLTQDLLAWIRADQTRPLLYPHLVFDTLADLRSEESPKQAQGTSRRYPDTLIQAFAAPWPLSGGPDTPCMVSASKPNDFQGDEAWLPPIRPKIRIALGADLVRAWTNVPQLVTHAQTSTKVSQAERPAIPPDSAQISEVGWSSEVTEALEHYRETFYRRTGVWLPKVTWLNDSSDLSGNRARRLRIMLLDDQDQDSRSVDVGSTQQDGIDRFIAALDQAISGSRLAWLDAEEAGRVASDKRNREILKTLGISVTDLKLLLRVVLSPISDEANTATTRGEGSVRDSDWLIPSLVFWKAFYTDEKAPKIAELLPDLAKGFRRLQVQRNAPVATGDADAVAVIQSGIQALEGGRLDAAAKSFQEALSKWPRDEVETLFVNRYAARWQASRRARTDMACVKPTEGTLDHSLRIEVEAMLDQPESRADRTAYRNLALCLLSSMDPTLPKAKAALRLKIAGQYGDPESWPAEQAAWLAAQLLDQYNPLNDPHAVMEQGVRFLTAAVRRLPNQDANDAFNKLVGVCNKPGPGNWCWSLLPAIADVRPDPWTALDFALTLSARESKTEVEQALHWADRADSLYASQISSAKKGRERFDFWTTYVRASSLYAIGLMDGDNQKLNEAQRSIPSLVDSPAVKDDPQLELNALGLAIRVLLDMPKPDRERALTFEKRGMENPRAGSEFLSRTTFYGLRLGDMATVRENVRLANERASGAAVDPQERSGLLFVTAVGGLLTESDASEWAARQFIRTGELYAPIVSMLLSARTTGVTHDSAKRLLDERWMRVDPSTWDRRLREGDRQAWYEMMVGCFAGKVQAGNIFDALRDDASLTASPFAGLHVTRKALLTEAYFYDALRLMASGDNTASTASLRRVVDLGYKPYIEYDIAVHLLSRAPTRDTPANSRP